jgi:hypothetical protein
VTTSTCTYPSQFSATCVPSLVANYSGSVRQNGSLGSHFVAGGTSPVYINSGGFQSMKNYPYLIGNAPLRAPFNLWAPGTHNFDASVRKSLPIWESVKFTFQADCFDVENKVTFGYASTSIDSSSFWPDEPGQRQSRLAVRRPHRLLKSKPATVSKSPFICASGPEARSNYLP